MLHEAVKSPYVDYNYYVETFLGSTIPERSFLASERKAEAFLHRITFGRVKRLPEIPNEVKDAICAMAEYNFRADKKTPGVKSENIDGYSVSYGESTDTETSRNTELYGVAKNYLSDTGLLHRGRSRKYDHKCGYHHL